MWKWDSIGFSAWLSWVLAAERPTRRGSPSASDRTCILEPGFPRSTATDLQVRPVLVSACAWRALPPCFEISKSTVHRRFLIWSRAGVRGRFHEEILHLDDAGLLDLWVLEGGVRRRAAPKK